MLISDFYPGIGGAERQAQSLSKAMMARGWSVRVVTRRHGYPHSKGLSSDDSAEGIPIVRVFSRGGRKIASFFYILGGLWHLLLHGRRGIYHAHDIGSPAWLALSARYLLGGRCIIKLRAGRDHYKKRFSSGVARWYFNRLLRLADRIIVVNSELERYLGELAIPAGRIVRVPNAADTEIFYPVSIKRKLKTRRCLGLPIDQTIVLYVGRIEAIKGVDILLHSWSLLPAKLRSESLLLLVGDGTQRKASVQLADSLGIQGSVLFAGKQQVVRDYYWAADLFVLPSRSEGLSNALVEAMSCGLLAVASDVGGAPDLVEDGYNGALFESENGNHLSQLLASLMAKPTRWEEMGLRGHQVASRHANLSNIADRVQSLYRQLD